MAVKPSSPAASRLPPLRANGAQAKTTTLPTSALAADGHRRIVWADQQMPVLRGSARVHQDQPLQGLRLGACLHITCETANLLRALKAGGAEVLCCASNPLSTQDDVAAALVKEYGIASYAIHGEDRDTYYSHLRAVLDSHPRDHDG